MKEFQETQNGKEMLDQFVRSSRELAYYLTEQEVNEAIVRDPNLAKDKDKKKRFFLRRTIKQF